MVSSKYLLILTYLLLTLATLSLMSSNVLCSSNVKEPHILVIDRLNGVVTYLVGDLDGDGVADALVITSKGLATYLSRTHELKYLNITGALINYALVSNYLVINLVNGSYLSTYTLSRSELKVLSKAYIKLPPATVFNVFNYFSNELVTTYLELTNGTVLCSTYPILSNSSLTPKLGRCKYLLSNVWGVLRSNYLIDEVINASIKLAPHPKLGGADLIIKWLGKEVSINLSNYLVRIRYSGVVNGVATLVVEVRGGGTYLVDVSSSKYSVINLIKSISKYLRKEVKYLATYSEVIYPSVNYSIINAVAGLSNGDFEYLVIKHELMSGSIEVLNKSLSTSLATTLINDLDGDGKPDYLVINGSNLTCLTTNGSVGKVSLGGELLINHDPVAGYVGGTYLYITDVKVYVSYLIKVVNYLDKTPPKLKLITPKDGLTYKSLNVIKFYVNDSESRVSKVLVALRTPSGYFMKSLGYVSGYVSIKLNLSKEGEYVLSIKAYNEFGLSKSLVATFYIDREVPKVVITYPSNGSIVGKYFMIRGFVKDYSPVNATFIINGVVTKELVGIRGWFSTSLSTINLSTSSIKLKAIFRDGVGLKDVINLVLTRDVKAPKIVVIEPINNSLINASSMKYLRIEFRVTDKHLMEVRAYLDNELLNLRKLDSTYYSLVDTTLLRNSNHVIKVVATDEVGNLATKVVRFKVVNPYSKPVIKVLTPVSGEVVHGYVKLKATILAASLVRVFIDGVPYKDLIVTNHSVSTLINTYLLKDGKHVIKLVGYSPLGTTSSSVIEVTVDNEAPKLNLTIPNSVRLGSKYLVGTHEVKLVIDIKDVTPNYLIICLNKSCSKYLAHVGSNYVVLKVRDGTYALSVVATDSLGRLSELPLTLVVSTEGPKLINVIPSNGSIIKSRVVKIKYVIHDVVGISNSYVAVKVGNRWFIRSNLSSSVGEVTTSLLPGTNYVKLVIKDVLGRESTYVLKYLVDAYRPRLSLIIKYLGGGKYLIKVRATDDVGIKWIRLSIDGRLIKESSKSFEVTTKLGIGTHLIQVLATDLGGHEASITKEVKVVTTGTSVSSSTKVFKALVTHHRRVGGGRYLIATYLISAILGVATVTSLIILIRARRKY